MSFSEKSLELETVCISFMNQVVFKPLAVAIIDFWDLLPVVVAVVEEGVGEGAEEGEEKERGSCWSREAVREERM